MYVYAEALDCPYIACLNVIYAYTCNIIGTLPHVFQKHNSEESCHNYDQYTQDSFSVTDNRPTFGISIKKIILSIF